jgi:hypothetical protein
MRCGEERPVDAQNERLDPVTVGDQRGGVRRDRFDNGGRLGASKVLLAETKRD